MNDRLVQEIRDHAATYFPREMVGCVVGGRFIPLDNISNRPEDRYQLRPKDKIMLFELGDSLEALVHSHTNNSNEPSGMDLESSKECGFDFWIIGTDGINFTDIRSLKNEAA